MSSKNPLKRLFGEPLVQFLLVGGCLYGATFLVGQEEDAPVVVNRVHVDAAQIGGMVTQWEKRWRRPPTREEMDGLIEKHVRDELFYRQAVAMGLDKDDPITRMRTAQKLEFLLNSLADAKQPTDAELAQYLTDHAEKYRSPDRITFYQAFFNPDTRKDATLDDAKAELERLRAAGTPDPATLEAGDRSLVKSYYEGVDRSGITRQMGSGFGEAVLKLEPGQWHGPVLSGYGVHLVYVFEVARGAMPELAAVRDRVASDWNDAHRKEFHADFLERLEAEYEIVIDEVEEGRLLATPADGE